jgi:hypothetical protein
VHQSLAARITARGARFALDPASAPALRDRVLAQWPEARQDAADRADRLLQGRYDFLGYRDIHCARNGRLDWHFDPIHNKQAPRVFFADVPFLDPEIGDHKVIWELNRHQHWLRLGRAAWLTGNQKYSQAIVTQLEDWLAQNPPLLGVNWASMLEISFRAISWTFALHCLLGVGIWDGSNAAKALRETGGGGISKSPWLVDMLISLDRQLNHVERHLSYYFSPNTHLTGEGLALYVAGTALPELASSQRWAEAGRSVLLSEIEKQILPDGGHVERSTHYQRYTLDFYLMATLTARLAGDEVSARRFEEAAGRLADFTRAMADGNGRLPHFGDDDGGMLWPFAGRACDDVRDSLALAGVVLDRPDLARGALLRKWPGSPARTSPRSSARETACRLTAGLSAGALAKAEALPKAVPACFPPPATSFHGALMEATPCSTLDHMATGTAGTRTRTRCHSPCRSTGARSSSIRARPPTRWTRSCATTCAVPRVITRSHSMAARSRFLTARFTGNRRLTPT